MKRNWIVIGAVVVACAGMIGCEGGSSSSGGESAGDASAYTAVFATGIGMDGVPTDTITSISLAADVGKILYPHVTWDNVDPGTYTYTGQWVDPDGIVLYEDTVQMTFSEASAVSTMVKHDRRVYYIAPITGAWKLGTYRWNFSLGAKYSGSLEISVKF